MCKGGRLKKFFNREICVCACLTQTRHAQKACAGMRRKIDMTMRERIAAGNPCRVIGEIGEQDQIYYYKDRVIDEDDLEEERKLR